MALVDWTKPKREARVAPESRKKLPKIRRPSASASAVQGPGTSGSGSAKGKDEEAAKPKPKLKRQLTKKLTKKFSRYFSRQSFVMTSDLAGAGAGAGAGGGNGGAGVASRGEEFYHEKDVTELVDPKYRKRWYVISPDGSFRKTWDMVQALALFYLALLVPIRVGYSVSTYGAPYIIDFALEAYFYVDFVINFVTGFENVEDHGKVIYDPSMIARHYLQTWCVVDFLGLLPVDLSLRISEGRFACSFREGGCWEGEGGPSGASAGTAGASENSSAQLLKMFKLLRLFSLIKLLRLFRISKLMERYQVSGADHGWLPPADTSIPTLPTHSGGTRQALAAEKLEPMH